MLCAAIRKKASDKNKSIWTICNLRTFFFFGVDVNSEQKVDALQRNNWL